MKIENRTPHAVALRQADGGMSLLPPVHPPVRLQFTPGQLEDATVAGVPVHGPSQLLGIAGLPPPREGVLLLVSQLAALGIGALHPERRDVVHPATGAHKGVRRDERGIVAVSAIVRGA